MMTSFKEFLRLDALNEKRGRVSKDPFHAKNVEFVKNYYNKDIPTSNCTNYIYKTRLMFLQAIEQHDKKLLDKLEDDSLESLKKLIDDYQIPMAKPLRKMDWKKAEKDIVDGLNKLFEDKFFTYTAKDGRRVLIDGTSFIAKLVGGSKDSDICIANLKTKKEVYVESKLDFGTSEYLKFAIQVKGGKLVYDHSFHLRNLDKEDKDRVDLLFSQDLDISGFLNNVILKSEVKDYWEQFLSNLDAVQRVVANDSEFKDIIGKVHLSQQFPDSANLLVKIFDTYVDYYVKKYEDLLWQMYDTLEGIGLDMPADYVDFQDGKRDVQHSFEQANFFIGMIYTWQESQDAVENILLKLDEKKLLALADELKTIEAKLSRIMDTIGTSNPNDLLRLNSTEKLRYFFAAFLSSTGRKHKGKHSLVLPHQDELGNMVVCPLIDVENSRLAKIVRDYYVKKDKCIYILIGDTIYSFGEDRNIFNLPKLPMFTGILTKFSISLLVSDDMSRISLHVKAYEPTKDSLKGCLLLSFKLHDSNYVKKKLKCIDIHA